MRASRSIFLRAAILTAIVTLTAYGHARASALIVPDNYASIQGAIDAASPGDTIIVRAGTYFENLTLNKPVILTAESYDPGDPTHNTTVIDGSVTSALAAITVSAGTSGMSTIRGFVIRNGNDGINVRSDVVVEYNYFISAGDQIDYGSDSGGMIRNNVFFASGDDGIDLDNMNRPLTIENNRILYSGDDGIEVRLQDSSAPAQPVTITIRDNEIIGCDEDGVQIIDYSQSLDTNRHMVIRGNLIANCRFAGIGLMPDQTSTENYSGADIVEAVRVYNNTLYGNDYGISGGDNLVAFNNIIANSATRGVWRVQGPAGSNSVVAYTLFYNNGTDADQSNLGAGNLFGQDPLFLSPPNAGPDGGWGTADDDFDGLVLVTGSPAIDAGVAQYIASDGEAIPPAPLTDFGGLAPDLGWNEFDPDRPPTATPTNSPTPTQAPAGYGEVTSQVSAAADDAEEAVSTGSVSLGSSDLELGADGTTSQLVGMRFNNISIPRGVSILSAYVEFEVDQTGSDPTSVLFQGQAADNPLAFSTAKYNISSRPRTAAQVAWNDIPAWTVVNAKWQTPDLSPIVQEIVNRPGWASGNSVVIIVSGSGRRTAESYNGEPAAAPKLVITYTSGDTPTPNLTPSETLTPTPTRTPTSTPSPSLTPVPAEAIRFAVIGDFGDGSLAEQDVANLIKGWNPDFILTTGDNNYPLGGADTIDEHIGQYYHEFIYPYIGSFGTGATINRFFPSLGNHDWETTNAQPYIDYFTLPGNERYYDFVWGPVHFFAMDSDSREPDGRTSSSTQGLWLETQLAASASPWNVVYMHHPPYSSGVNHGSTTVMQWPYQAWGADAVLAGHDHTYERIVLDGFPYFVNGLGGSSIYAFSTPVTGSEVRYNGDYGAMLVEAGPSYLTFQFVTRTGVLVDTYTLGTVSTATPASTETATPTDTLTPTPTETGTPTESASPTPTETPAPTFTPTDTAAPTDTATPTETATHTSTETPAPTFTPTETPTQTATSTETATLTHTPTFTSTGTATPTETGTATSTPADTGTPTETASPTPTETPAPTFTPSETPILTATSTETATPTQTPTSTPTDTAVPTETGTATSTPTDTGTPTETATFTPTATLTPAYTPTETSTPTFTPTDTATPTLTSTPTLASTATETSIPTSTATSSPTATHTPTNTATPGPSLVDTSVSSEIAVAGTVSGTYLLTQLDDGTAESITERESGGKPQNRYSFLEHKWIVNVPAGNVITLYANAWRSGSSDGDTFLFAYSTDDVTYTDMFTVANTSDAGAVTFVLPPSTQGTLYVRVTDSDRNPGGLGLDTIYLDHLFVRTETVPGDPPVAPSSLSAMVVSVTQINLDWIDNATDEYGFYVERSLDGTNWTRIDVLGKDVTTYMDVNVFPNTTFYYRVQAYNASGGSGYSNVASATTPDGLSLTALGYKIKGIQTVDLSWEGDNVSAVDIYRDGNLIAVHISGNTYTDDIGLKGGGSYRYQVCEAGSLTNCSGIVQVDF